MLISAIAGAAFAIALAVTWWVRRMALARGLLDFPNARSSHSQPTPRGGGLAIVIASGTGVCGLAACRIVDVDLAIAIIGGGLPIAWIGFLDDRGSLSATVRFLVHVSAASWAIYMLGGVPPMQVGHRTLDPGIAGDVFAAVAIVWVVNLFNFMDGIDGLAASEVIFVAAAGAALGLIGGMSPAVPAAALTVAAAGCGFLVWNWPPAKIFMGDVGSGYLGYVIATLALATARESPAGAYSWLILGAVFFVDATVTLVRRMLRGERVHLAHRSHAYQRLARRWGGHLPVTAAVWAINLLWLLPCAFWSTLSPEFALQVLALAFAPVLALVLVAGAGRAERVSLVADVE